MKPNLYKVPLTITVDAAGIVQYPTVEVSILAYDEGRSCIYGCE